MIRGHLTWTFLLIFFFSIDLASAAGECCVPQSAIDGCNANVGRCYWDNSLCNCICSPSPIVIDVTGNGFHLTSLEGGVTFDFFGTGTPIQVSWTAWDSGNAWLVLDRDGDGRIDSAKEMFGNITDQSPSGHPNGFLALAEFDKPENGGNGDGIIDSQDSIFVKLRLWIDSNHDGVSQPNELFTLPALGIYSISLDYHLSGRNDEFGNSFRYRARINQGLRTSAGPWAYDVTLVTTDNRKH